MESGKWKVENVDCKWINVKKRKYQIDNGIGCSS